MGLGWGCFGFGAGLGRGLGWGLGWIWGGFRVGNGAGLGLGAPPVALLGLGLMPIQALVSPCVPCPVPGVGTALGLSPGLFGVGKVPKKRGIAPKGVPKPSCEDVPDLALKEENSSKWCPHIPIPALSLNKENCPQKSRTQPKRCSHIPILLRP